MLIELDKSLEGYLEQINDQLNENSLEVIALNNLANAYRNGWHIIIGSLKVLKLIKRIKHIDNSTKRVFDKLIQEYTYQKSYKDLMEEYIIIKSPTHTFHREDVDKDLNSKPVFEVPLNYFYKLSRCFKSTILCEDESDYNFYKNLANKYIEENKDISKIKLSFSFTNGGGANSYKVFATKINEDENPILAVADSDKKYPNSKIGQTLEQLIKKKNIYLKTNIMDVYSIKVRAKENLIPPSLYLIGTNSSSRGYLEKLYCIEQQNHLCETLLYLNIKDGYEARHFKDEQFIEFFRNMFTEVQDLISCGIEDIYEKRDKDIVLNGAKGMIDQFIYNIFEDGLEIQLESKKKLKDPTPELKEEIAVLEKNLNKKKNLFKHIPDYIKIIILTLCKKIMYWGCSKGEILAT